MPGIAPDEACNRLASCRASSIDVRSETRRRSSLSTFLQRIEPCLGLLQVGSIKPLSEPRVHRGEKVVGFVSLPLPLPQCGEAGGGTEFPRLCLLILSYRYSLGKTSF